MRSRGSTPEAGSGRSTAASRCEARRGHCLLPCAGHLDEPEIKRYADRNSHIGEVVARTAAQCYRDLLRSGGDRAESVVLQAPLLSSFGREALLAARTAAPELPRGYLVDDVPENFAAELEELGCVSLHTDHETLTRDKARAVKDAGYWLFCYTVDDPARAREIFGWGWTRCAPTGST